MGECGQPVRLPLCFEPPLVSATVVLDYACMLPLPSSCYHILGLCLISFDQRGNTIAVSSLRALAQQALGFVDAASPGGVDSRDVSWLEGKLGLLVG